MSNWYIANSSSDESLVRTTIQTEKSRVEIVVSSQSLRAIDMTSINQRAVELICPVGFPPDIQLAILEEAKEGIDGILKDLYKK